MSVNVETLEKLERKIVLNVSTEAIQNEVSKRLKRLARDVKMDGFRPGKVPMSVVSQRYGYSVQYEVLNDQVANAFADAVKQAELRVVGQPSISEKEAVDGQLVFEAVFEVYPEVKIGDLSDVEVEKLSAEVNDAAIDRTIDILRKQRRTFVQRAEWNYTENGDRVNIDFVGNIDGEPFEGGKAEGFEFVLGDGQMLSEFENAVLGMKVGESKTFPLAFPEDYHGKEVAGKTADFMITLNKIEYPVLPDVDDAFAASLDASTSTVEGLRADIRKNLEREVKYRLLARNKQAAMDVLAQKAELDVPKAAVQAEVQRLIEAARADMKQRGMKDVEKAEIPPQLFTAQAERRVRLGLVVSELAKANSLYATSEQVMAHVQELSSSYEQPEDVVRWYTSSPDRLSELQGVVLENNVADFVLSKAKVVDKTVSFEELMGQQA
ncbi:MAG: Trigger factor [Pseudomonadota bacterium]